MTPGRILVVDDHPANLRLATEVLAGAGYDVLKAADAEEALAIVEQTPIDLILMDISLPGMDGLELTRRLKADESTRQLCIVALTALAMRGDDQKALDAGCDGYITKPIDTRRLPSQVAEFLRRKAEGKAPPWVF